MAEEVVSPYAGQAAACTYGKPHLGSRRNSSPRSPPGLLPPVGGQEVFGMPMVMINEVIRLQLRDEKVTAQPTVVEQQAVAEAKAREERTVEQFLEAQARYQSDLPHQARQAVQQNALEEKSYFEAHFHFRGQSST